MDEEDTIPDTMKSPPFTQEGVQLGGVEHCIPDQPSKQEQYASPSPSARLALEVTPSASRAADPMRQVECAEHFAASHGLN